MRKSSFKLKTLFLLGGLVGCHSPFNTVAPVTITSTPPTLQQEVRPSTKGTRHITPDLSQSVRPSTKGTRHLVEGQWVLPKAMVQQLLQPSRLSTSAHILAPSRGDFSTQSTSVLTPQVLADFSAWIDQEKQPLNIIEIQASSNQDVIVHYQLKDVGLSTNHLLELQSSDQRFYFASILQAPLEEERLQQNINLETTASALLIQQTLREQNKKLQEIAREKLHTLIPKEEIQKTAQHLEQRLQQAQPMLEQKSSQVILIKDGRFQPESLTMRVGDSVSWKYQGTTGDTLISRENLFTNQHMVNGQTLTYAFQQTGEFRFKLKESSSLMTIIVRD